ncbi:hypothetical protein GJ744_004647 [Endocarpon pusillum]|uniref:Uncharacterized protein n=1 Tax=Endocarpon pusillum TaxID=364733 RepID=A0A8H7ALW8_9EURO|nr:hypothetical protein GJ744_004647 [Endocarpon pusillum]
MWLGLQSSIRLPIQSARINRSRKPLPCTIQIPRDVGRSPVSGNGELGGISVVTSNGLRMAEAAGDAPVVIRRNREEYSLRKYLSNTGGGRTEGFSLWEGLHERYDITVGSRQRG